jgi:Mg2+ and Co2+ transporter CorA
MTFDSASSAFNMPELLRQYAYPAATLGTLLVALLMLVHFHEREYI